MFKFQVQGVAQTQTNRANPEINQKRLGKEKLQKSRVSQTYPLRNISSSRFGCSGSHWNHTVSIKLIASQVSFLLHSVSSVASNICLLRGFTSPIRTRDGIFLF